MAVLTMPPARRTRGLGSPVKNYFVREGYSFSRVRRFTVPTVSLAYGVPTPTFGLNGSLRALGELRGHVYYRNEDDELVPAAWVRVYAFMRRTKTPVGGSRTDATGAYRIAGLAVGYNHFVVAYDDDNKAPLYNAVIKDRVLSVMQTS